jgi:hypothetical protein
MRHAVRLIDVAASSRLRLFDNNDFHDARRNVV